MNIHLPHNLAKKILTSFIAVVAIVLAIDSAWAQTPTQTTRVLDDIPVGWTVTAGGVEVTVTPYYTGSLLGSAIIPEDAVVVLTPPDSLKPRVKNIELLSPEEIPLTFEAKEANATVKFAKVATTLSLNNLEYNVYDDNGWQTYTFGTNITLSNIGDKVSFRGNNAAYATTPGSWSTISCSDSCYIYGNIMSLVSPVNYANNKTLTGDYAFYRLFYQNTHIVNHPSKTLVLPAETLTLCCYRRMFEGCTSLTMTPALPATTLAEWCYNEMFKGCIGLTVAPSLPAMSLANCSYCYNCMFEGCTSLTTAPALPATTLANYCYDRMFKNCTGLTTVPALPATSLADYCYYSMFEGCTSLTTVPALPATTLADGCYNSMFYGCTSLTTAPTLPAPTLQNYCYSHMFEGCTNLNSVTCLATNISATNCTMEWLDNVAAMGTFIKPASMTNWIIDNPSGIPPGWTVIPEGALPGQFTVNAGGGKVNFSQGNLQYQASTNTWRFATNQYEAIGSDNSNVSPSYSGWIDLFGWGSGNQPTQTSEDPNVYSTFVDWGTNAISNGGNTANLWCTLSESEWTYLIFTRPNASSKRGRATVNGMYCFVLLPDEWELPTGLSFTPDANDWTNIYITEQWTQMEAAGAVCLPIAGSRAGGDNNTRINDFNHWGCYWSSTSANSTQGYNLWITPDHVGTTDKGNYQMGASARLVYETPYFLGAGTEADPYLISSEADWNYLAVKVNSGTSYAGKFFRQTANINVTTMVGVSESKPFSGTYDGDGYTLNLNLNTTVSHTAPFRFIANATIKNVVTTGSVYSTSNHPSGLVGITDGTCTIQNCLVSANVGGAQHSGGIVGHSWHANISIIGCVYSGTLSPANGQKTGGILGWGGDEGGHTMTISNCLFAGSLAPNSNTQFHPIGIVQNTNNTRLLSNTYYTVAHNMDDENTHGNSFVKGLTYKGKFARSITGGTGVMVANAGTATEYNVSGITSYGTGILYGGVLYAGGGEAVSLTLSHAEAPSGTTFSQYTVTGGGTLSNPTSNSSTLTMTDANQVINVQNKGKFTINSNGDKIYFSPGNLQATYNGSSWSWAFAANQWEYVGGRSSDGSEPQTGNNFINGNGTVSANGTVDLFGWSTNTTTLGIHNSGSNDDYSGDFVDWGNNANLQAGIGAGWRTPTSDEWTCVFNTRTSGSTVNGTSDARYTHATINTDVNDGVKGIILFPDGVTIAADEATSWGAINNYSPWGTKCTTAQWAALEAKGCVFLPAAGHRAQAIVNVASSMGFYWSSSPYTPQTSYAYGVRFYSDYVSPAYYSCNRMGGSSVRLVRNANVIDLSTVTSDTIVPNGWSVTGTLGENHKISIAAGATVTLDNVNINRTSSSYPGITCEGTATINLVGENTVNGGSQKAGILIGGSGTTLTINGSGSLSATGGSMSAGIGLSRYWETNYTGGNIVINGGTITARSSGVFTSGIGTGCVGSSRSVIMGDITINGGTVIAYGSQAGAGIGTGFCYPSCTNRVGNITITSGSVTVTGGANDATNPGGTAIGAGPSNYANSTNEVGNITISGGTVTATCGTFAVSTIGKSSANSVCGDITFGGAPTTPTITLNNPNNSGEMVSARSFMNPGTNKHLSFPEIEEFENAGFTTFNGFTIVSPSYGFQCGCFSVTQFKYVPYP